MNAANRWVGITVICLLISTLTGCGIEEPPYTVERRDGRYQLRNYPEHIVAEISVDASHEEAGNRGFRPLFRYISGANRSKTKIAMTAPVGQQTSAGEKIAMTAPVGQQAVSNGWVVTFAMPEQYTLETLPEPTDERVTLRKVPPVHMAVVRYAGRWTSDRYDRYLETLQAWMAEQGLKPKGNPIWARYNSPFSLPIFRRNEVMIPVHPPTESTAAE